MQIPKLAIFCVCLYLLLSFPLTVFTAVQGVKASDGTQTLLLDGKTASAKSAKLTAKGVAKLLTDHKETAQQQQEIAKAIFDIEKHFDKTIRSAITQAAGKVALEIEGTAISK